MGDLIKIHLDFPLSESLSLLEEPCQGEHPLFHQLVALPFLHLIGLGLVFQEHQQVPIAQGGKGPADQGQGDFETAVALQAGEVDGDDRDEVQPVLFQRLAQQVDIVGGTAAAAGLRHHQRHLMQIILPAVQRMHQLPDGQQRRIAGVVMYIFQAFIHNFPSGGAQKLHFVTKASQHVLDQLKVNGGHIGSEDGIFLLHLLGEFNSVLFVCHSNSFLLRFSEESRLKTFQPRRRSLRLLVLLVFDFAPAAAHGCRGRGPAF